MNKSCDVKSVINKILKLGQWFCSVIMTLCGICIIWSSFISGLLFTFSGLCIIPPLFNYLKIKFIKKSFLLIIISIILFFVGVMFLPELTEDEFTSSINRILPQEVESSTNSSDFVIKYDCRFSLNRVVLNGKDLNANDRKSICGDGLTVQLDTGENNLNIDFYYIGDKFRVTENLLVILNEEISSDEQPLEDETISSDLKQDDSSSEDNQVEEERNEFVKNLSNEKILFDQLRTKTKAEIIALFEDYFAESEDCPTYEVEHTSMLKAEVNNLNYCLYFGEDEKLNGLNIREDAYSSNYCSGITLTNKNAVSILTDIDPESYCLTKPEFSSWQACDTYRSINAGCIEMTEGLDLTVILKDETDDSKLEDENFKLQNLSIKPVIKDGINRVQITGEIYQKTNIIINSLTVNMVFKSAYNFPCGNNIAGFRQITDIMLQGETRDLFYSEERSQVIECNSEKVVFEVKYKLDGVEKMFQYELTRGTDWNY